MKPMSISTEFTFSINRDYVSIITNSFEGGMFEDIKVSYGKKTGNVILKNCHVVYTFKNTIQLVDSKTINFKLINNYQKIHKNLFFKRIETVKNIISTNNNKGVRIKTIISFVDNIHVGL